MRAKPLFVLGLALFLGACSPKVNRAPPPLNKQLLTGKWKNTSDEQIIAGYEFGEDGTLKVTVRGMGQPVLAHYAWNGERTLGVDYQAPAEVQQAYKATAKAFKDGVRDRIRTGKLPAVAGPSVLGAVRDELPASETVRVALEENPPFLILDRENSTSETLKKED
jgi:hypothetical protein